MRGTFGEVEVDGSGAGSALPQTESFRYHIQNVKLEADCCYWMNFRVLYSLFQKRRSEVEEGESTPISIRGESQIWQRSSRIFKSEDNPPDRSRERLERGYQKRFRTFPSQSAEPIVKSIGCRIRTARPIMLTLCRAFHSQRLSREKRLAREVRLASFKAPALVIRA
jgi:hypothetical protein